MKVHYVFLHQNMGHTYMHRDSENLNHSETKIRPPESKGPSVPDTNPCGPP